MWSGKHSAAPRHRRGHTLPLDLDVLIEAGTALQRAARASVPAATGRRHQPARAVQAPWRTTARRGRAARAVQAGSRPSCLWSTARASPDRVDEKGGAAAASRRRARAPSRRRAQRGRRRPPAQATAQRDLDGPTAEGRRDGEAGWKQAAGQQPAVVHDRTAREKISASVRTQTAGRFRRPPLPSFRRGRARRRARQRRWPRSPAAASSRRRGVQVSGAGDRDRATG